MNSNNGELLLITVNHETVPMEDRERYSLDKDQVRKLYETLRETSIVDEALILSTCNRFELYSKTIDPEKGADSIIEALQKFYRIDAQSIRNHAVVQEGQAAIKHLIEVSAGLKSQIVGEAEIFGQVKDAYAMCQKLGYAGSLLNRLFQKGFQAAKLIRHSTSIGEGQINISNVAVSLSLKIFGGLDHTSALIVGTGEIGEKTAKALRSRGAKSFGVASHSLERTQGVAETWGGTPRVVSEIESYLNEYDIIISSTELNEPLLTQSSLEQLNRQRKNRPLFLIDLGLPRNIDPSCAAVDDVYLYNLDDLAKIAEDNLSERRAAIKSSEAIAAKKSELIWKTLVNRGLVSFR